MKKTTIQDLILVIVILIIASLVGYIYYWGTMMDNAPKNGVIDVHTSNKMFVPVLKNYYK